MTGDDVALLVQAAAVVVAVGASIVALIVSALDRRAARQIAAEDRRSAAKQARLLVELDAAVRLTQNLSRGGSSDPQEAAAMGAEAMALVGLLGERRVPALWRWKVGDEEALREALRDETFPDWRRQSIEAQLAVNTIAADLGRLHAGDD